ncbi:hypothetical protein CEXT_674151 [Caerostris extrusa]|uniref:Uncharacterized protein n=1 Tax=Caerostris extrusa TaxID=172846 RepID=A0AAV4SZF7_CAEEX|nr:hypothetical protein CEXT_674151 [Caerostris extrusa]
MEVSVARRDKADPSLLPLCFLRPAIENTDTMTMKDDYLFPMYRFIGRADSGSFVNRRVNLQKETTRIKHPEKRAKSLLEFFFFFFFFSFFSSWTGGEINLFVISTMEKRTFKDEDGEEQPHNERI